jgi:hypothetical protein
MARTTHAVEREPNLVTIAKKATAPGAALAEETNEWSFRAHEWQFA